jgi:hypothetical protein
VSTPEVPPLGSIAKDTTTGLVGTATGTDDSRVFLAMGTHIEWLCPADTAIETTGWRTSTAGYDGHADERPCPA